MALLIEKAKRLAGLRVGDGLDCFLSLPPHSDSALDDLYEIRFAGLGRFLARNQQPARAGELSAEPRRVVDCRGIINGFFGLLVAWVLVRYRFPGRRLLDGLVDLPFALPTAVAGNVLTTMNSQNGWIGSQLAKIGIKVSYTPLGVVVALTFIGLPFVVRTVQPVLQVLDVGVEEAAASLGAGLWQTDFAA